MKERWLNRGAALIIKKNLSKCHKIDHLAYFLLVLHLVKLDKKVTAIFAELV